MRRHVENQVEVQERDILGILILFAMWALALMALSSAARAEEKQPAQTAAAAQKTATEIQKTNDKGGAQHRLQSDTDEQVTLTRFLLISIPDRRLALVDNGQVTRIYPIAIGAAHTPSPKGNFTIVSRVANPSWAHKGKVAAPGKNNPVGSRWMGLSLKGYGIHGTNAPKSIGKAASHGCFRMGKRDVEELFALVQVGDTVAVRAERDELVTQVFSDSNSETQIASAAAVSVDADER